MDEDTRESVMRFISKWHGEEREDLTYVDLTQYLASLQQNMRDVKLVRGKKLYPPPPPSGFGRSNALVAHSDKSFSVRGFKLTTWHSLSFSPMVRRMYTFLGGAA